MEIRAIILNSRVCAYSFVGSVEFTEPTNWLYKALFGIAIASIS
jgi:hypothetical protein